MYETNNKHMDIILSRLIGLPWLLPFIQPLRLPLNNPFVLSQTYSTTTNSLGAVQCVFLIQLADKGKVFPASGYNVLPCIIGCIYIWIAITKEIDFFTEIATIITRVHSCASMTLERNKVFLLQRGWKMYYFITTRFPWWEVEYINNI